MLVRKFQGPDSPPFFQRATGATLLAIALLTATAGASWAAAPANPGTSGQRSESPGAMSAGKYIALAADCASCHTAPGGKPFAGGDALKSAFGTIYGPNITSDKATGIGTWTKADFDRALRRGISKDGSYLYPAMPYDAYTKMSATDMDALWNYIKSIPAVSNKPPENTLPFPFTIRSGMAVWQRLYFKPGLFTPVASKSAQWNRGAYLVEALGHCADCHTPRNLAQGLESQHQLAGAKIEGWYAPDICNDPLSKISQWKSTDLARFLKTGVSPGNSKVVGPMQEVVHDSLGKLNEGDLLAIAVYLKDQPKDVKPVTADKVTLPRERLMAGKQVYEDNCSGCHHSNGKGVKGAAPALAGDDAVTASEPYNVVMALLEGFPPQGSWGAMGSFAGTLNDDQIADVTNYVRTAWGNDAEPNATPWSVETWRKNAQPTAPGTANALLCPNLPQDEMQPAFKIGTDALKRAAGDRAKMDQVVDDYLTARPKSSTAQVIEALSTAYCRSLADAHVSQGRMSAQIADFAQNVAIAASAHAKRS